MRLARAVDIEISQPDDLCAVVFPAPAHDLVKQEFGVTVNVERLFIGPPFLEHRAGAVHRSR